MATGDDKLCRLTRAGCSFLDLNHEYLQNTDWSRTPLGPRDAWPASLTSFADLSASFPHAAAILWGVGDVEEYTIVQNLGFLNACEGDSQQGKQVKDYFGEDILSGFRACLQGRSVRVGHHAQLRSPDDNADATVLLSPLLGGEGLAKGILLQLLPMSSSGDTQFNGGVAQSKRNQHLTGSKEDSQGENADQEDFEEEHRINIRENNLFRHFAQILPTGLAVLDDEANVLFVNDEFYSLTTRRTLSYPSWPECIHPDDFDNVMTAYQKAFATAEPLRVEFRCLEGKDNPWRLFLMRSIREQPGDGAFLCVVIDITELKAAELSQRKAAGEATERKEQQERFIDMISHEIRNPLSAVLHSADAIKDALSQLRQGREDEPVNDIVDAVDVILLCVAHQSALVDDILSFSKIDAMMLTLNPKPTQLKASFAECLKLFQPELRAKHITFEYILDISYSQLQIDWLVADLKRLNQVMVNLMTNAIKFTARNKDEKERKITVAIGASKERATSYPPSVVFFDTEDAAYKMDSTMLGEWGSGEPLYIMVAIKDTGIGINPENQAKLFERFRQATPKTQDSYGGSGLGLFISRKLCHLHGGDIGVSSEEGKGCTFSFFFRVRRTRVSTTDEAKGNAEEVDQQQTSLSSQASDRVTPGREKRPSDAQNLEDLEDTRKAADGAVEIAQRPDLTSQHVSEGIIPQSLKNSQVGKVPEAHPTAAADDRYNTTDKVASKIEDKSPKDSLPSDRFSDANPPKHHQNTTLPTGSHSLLLVEDNLINQRVLQRQLKARGFKVTPANNGREAVDIVRDGLKLSLILMDQEMPIMDGNSATKAIRELEESGEMERIPILGVSANVRDEQRSSMIDAGMDDCISKPFKVDELVERIKELLRPP